MPSENNDNRDDFWDIDMLVPKKKRALPFSHDISAVELEIPPSNNMSQPSQENNKLTTSSASAPNVLVPDCEYEIKSGLVRRVKISKWSANYSFYEQFRTDAQNLHYANAKKVEYQPFFSYTPQYKQLSRGQLEWYLWWRENLRCDVYLQSDYSYILLYIYEIINLPDIIPPNEGLRLLCGIWLAYRDNFPRIDKYLAEWLCDYCLIHQLPLPGETLAPIIPLIFDKCSFKEFYMQFDESSPEAYADILIKFASNYSWKAGKYVTEETAPLYEKHITGALSALLLNDKGAPELGYTGTGTLCRLSRDAFSGSLCAHNVKRRIEIYYYSFTRSYSLRFAVTNLVKYAENRLRSRLGIKSRLGVTSISDRAKQIVDRYYDEQMPVKKVREKATAPEEPKYMTYYEAQSTGISPERASDIEQNSWQTTQLLLDAFEEPDTGNEPFDIEAETVSGGTDVYSSAAAPGGYKELLAALDPICTDFLRLALYSPKGEAERFAISHSELPEHLADTINELSVNICGDILLEDDCGYAVIADYSEEIKECLNPI